MTVPYTKQPTSIPEQLAHLESRGLVIEDRAAALRDLSCIGYYRFKGYVHALRILPENGQLRKGAKFGDAMYFYELDRELRFAVFQALEYIEVAIRALIVERLTLKFGPYAHQDPSALQDRKRKKEKDGSIQDVPVFNRTEWLAKLDESVKNSHEKFILHFEKKYDNFPEVPFWVAMQLTSFGTLAKIYYGCVRSVRESVAQAVGLHEPVLVSWLHTLSYVRNICAHHSRLWNRELAVRPRLPDSKYEPLWSTSHTGNRMFLGLLILRRLLRGLKEDGKWAAMVERAFSDSFNHVFTARGMGFPYRKEANGSVTLEPWTEHPLWK